MGPTGAARILQLHPTRRCNLQCLHCYSLSGPQERAELPEGLLKRALTDASREGYNVAGFSGGEPILYPPLRSVLEHARACGMRTTVTSNGMLLDDRRVELLAGAVDLLAISLDGKPESHNRMRASDRAFETMHKRLPSIRDSGITFGFIFTLTQHNEHELDWVAEFALAEGAKLLQVHPLELAGRARVRLPESRPDTLEAGHAYVRAMLLQQRVGNRLRVHVDLAPRVSLLDQPAAVFAAAQDGADALEPLADLVSPLVVEADGFAVPIKHGFAREYALGDLHEAPLADLGARWRRERLQAFRELCRRAYRDVTAANAPFIANWYDAVSDAVSEAVLT